jgi:site-specific DNA recombinase
LKKEKIKVYLYTRVSTTMQIDGYSLDAQKTKMKAFCDYNEYEIAGEYEDAGKSSKSIEGRIAFNQMMDDIKSRKDAVSYVLVFKLSRFGRNAADVLATLQVMQDFGVNLICVEDGIDSSRDAGKLMISVLSAVAEIERENIRVQTMEGKWNGGFAPYGYSLIDGKLEVNEEEASLIRRIIQNPVYSGKISYGRRRTEKVHGTRNEYRQVKKDDYLLVDGLNEALVSEEVWE